MKSLETMKSIIFTLFILLTLTSFKVNAADKWEYQLRTYIVQGYTTQVLQGLTAAYNKEGEAGWEIVTIERLANSTLVTFKRKK
jgi:hypothetical protein